MPCKYFTGITIHLAHLFLPAKGQYDLEGVENPMANLGGFSTRISRGRSRPATTSTARFTSLMKTGCRMKNGLLVADRPRYPNHGPIIRSRQGFACHCSRNVIGFLTAAQPARQPLKIKRWRANNIRFVCRRHPATPLAGQSKAEAELGRLWPEPAPNPYKSPLLFTAEPEAYPASERSLRTRWYTLEP